MSVDCKKPALGLDVHIIILFILYCLHMFILEVQSIVAINIIAFDSYNNVSRSVLV